MEAITVNVDSRCGCEFREDYITDRVFQCFPSSPHTVTYHAQLHGTLQANVSQLSTALQEWASSVGTVAVQFLPLSVESFCAVTSSSPLEQCPTDATTPSVDTSAQFSVIVAVSVVVVALVVCGITIAVVVIAVLRHRSANYNLCSLPKCVPALLHCYPVIPLLCRPPPLSDGELVHMNTLALEESNEYDYIRRYSPKIPPKIPNTEETTNSEHFNVVQCPAYLSTSPSKLELVLEESAYEEV